MRFVKRNFDYDEATEFSYRVQSLLTGDLWTVPATGWHSDDTSRQPVVGGWYIMEATHE